MTGEDRLIDTNILVHAYTLSEERKHRIASTLVEAIWEGQSAATTLQNLCEFFVVVTRKVAKPLPPAEAEVLIQGILAASQWRVIDRRSETVVKAMGLVKAYRASFWDALIAACMLEHGLQTILTENEADFRKIPGMIILNPFKARVAHPQSP